MTLIPQKIKEDSKILDYLQKRQLVSQYKKAKSSIINGLQTSSLKLLQPKDKGIWSFRINKQFRALGIYHKESQTLRIFEINNHQNL